MTFEQHEKAVLAACNTLNEAIYAAAADKVQVRYEKWRTTVDSTSTDMIGRVELVREVK